MDQDPKPVEAERIKEWCDEYTELAAHPPEDGDFLYARDSNGIPQMIKLEVELIVGRTPFIFTRANLPQEVGSKLEWYGQGINDLPNYSGWKVVIADRSKAEVIRRFTLALTVIPVKSIRILRQSKTGKSLIGEVVQF